MGSCLSKCNTRVDRKQNSSGKRQQRGSNNAFMSHTSPSAARVEAIAEALSAGSHSKKNGNHTRASSSSKGLKEKEKIQIFDRDSPKLLLSSPGNADQDSHSKGENSWQEAKSSADSIEKYEDQTRASTSQGKEKITQLHVKSKHQAEKVAPRPSPNNQYPTYHIRWDGFEESEKEPLGQRCCLCDVDLAYEPVEEEAEDEVHEHEHERFPKRPEVAVLACGHTFHEHCLLSATPEELSRDPPCCICISLD